MLTDSRCPAALGEAPARAARVLVVDDEPSISELLNLPRGSDD